MQYTIYYTHPETGNRIQKDLIGNVKNEEDARKLFATTIGNKKSKIISVHNVK